MKTEAEVTASNEGEANAAELAAERDRNTILEAKIREIAEGMKARLPESLQALIPSNLSISEQIDWMNAAAKTDLAKRPVVPVTDTRPPATTTPKPDLSALSPQAKIAAGYASSVR